MPNHALSVFKQLKAKAEERGRDIGTFVQRGTTFERYGAQVKIQPDAILYQVTVNSRCGEENYMGRFELSNRALTTSLIQLLAKSHRTMSAKLQREP